MGCSVLTLAACGGRGNKPKSTTPVLGNRTSILGGNQLVVVDDSVANTPVTLPAPTTNADWAQPGGDSSKAMGHVALGESLNQAWSTSIAGGGKRARLASSPVISGGKLYVIDTNATVSAFDAKSGARLWTSSVRDKDGKGNNAEFGGGVSVGGDRLYVTTGIGDVAALNIADGSQLWKKRPGGPLRGSATVANGHIYVMSQDNQIFALSQEDGTVVWTESGTVQSTAIFGVAAPAAAQGTVIAGFSSGELTAYRYENGRVLWGDALSRTSISTTVAALTDIDADPVIDRGRVFAIGQGGRMASYELVSGQRLWEINIAGVATPAIAGDWVFVVTDASRLFCVERATGKIRWISQLTAFENEKKKSGIVRWHGPLLAGGRLILVSTEGKLTEVDPANGSIRHEREMKGAMSLAPVAADGMLYILTDDGRLVAYR
ncbi:PQQ-binding-like beta-propeller repeat protein [Sphingobium sufflavum]|nr:PQQ-binding-like beta-propeller repeat protein [Sphingobium sufflavum]MCE7797930.1 PQQ-binding-like beta-propeller repeat protein [Sphingobium sufflavum]